MSSYGGVTFQAVSNAEHTLPDWAPSRLSSERQVAGSNVAVFQFGGRAPDALSLTIWLTGKADYDLLVTKLGSAPSTMVYRGVTYANVLLTQIGEAQQFSKDRNPNENVVCTVLFRRGVA